MKAEFTHSTRCYGRVFVRVVGWRCMCGLGFYCTWRGRISTLDTSFWCLLKCVCIMKMSTAGIQRLFTSEPIFWIEIMNSISTEGPLALLLLNSTTRSSGKHEVCSLSWICRCFLPRWVKSFAFSFLTLKESRSTPHHHIELVDLWTWFGRNKLSKISSVLCCVLFRYGCSWFKGTLHQQEN